jgi:hypothetical protein
MHSNKLKEIGAGNAQTTPAWAFENVYVQMVVNTGSHEHNNISLPQVFQNPICCYGATASLLGTCF